MKIQRDFIPSPNPQGPHLGQVLIAYCIGRTTNEKQLFVKVPSPNPQGPHFRQVLIAYCIWRTTDEKQMFVKEENRSVSFLALEFRESLPVPGQHIQRFKLKSALCTSLQTPDKNELFRHQ
jgi:hypothetical protein